MIESQRNTFQKLMAEVEALEDRIAELRRLKAKPSVIDAEEAILTARRNELQRLSDGCGHPHHH